MTTIAVSLALVLMAGAPSAQTAPPQPAGIAAFARHPMFRDARISTTGKYLGLVAVEGGKNSLVIMNLETREFASGLAPSGPTMVGSFYWANEDRVVAELVDKEGELASPVTRGELFAVNANGRVGTFIYGYRAGEAQVGSNIRRAERELGWGFFESRVRGDRRRVLVSATSWQEEDDRRADLYRLDVYSGKKERVTMAPVPEATFVADEDGEPRIASAPDGQGKMRVFYRDPGQPWRDLASMKGLGPTSSPRAFAARDRTMYVVDASPQGFGVFAVSVDTGERKLLVENRFVPPSYGAFERARQDGSLVLDPATHRLVAVEFEPDLPAYEFVDANHPLARALRGLQETYPDEHVRLVNTTDDGKQAVVKLISDRDPGRFLLLDVGKMTARPILEVRPWIRADAMAETNAFHITASDGFRIHGYVTIPRAAAKGVLPPLVVLPHGGPHGVRDRWEFDNEVQLLASEGFAVLRVNFRGSGGHGDAYQEAGYGKWGDRVMQDVVDATRFALRKGFGDPNRVCAYGSSFGGYAAVQAAIVAPDLFRCAVGTAGIYDLTQLASTGDIALKRLGREQVRTVFGQDEAALRRVSPVYNAEKIKARVLLVHGKEDQRAPIEHAEKLRQALERAGNPPEWLVEPKEGHGFYDEGARERMYTRIVAFLRENTAPRTGAGAAVPAKTPAPAEAPRP